MMRHFAALAAGMLLMAPAVPAQDAKDDAAKQKEKDKAAKAKPPARSYSDDDLKKYKAPPKDAGGAQAGAGDSDASEAPVPGQRRSREYGGYQKLPPPAAAPAGTQTQVAPPAPSSDASDDKSPEEVEWRRRAAEARRPVQQAEGKVQQIEAKIADLRDQLNPMSTKYVLGGNSTAGPGAVYEIEEQLRNLESELVEARAALAEAEKAWQRFLEEARAGGASPAWLNP